MCRLTGEAEMWMFIAGLFVGANAGLLIFALCRTRERTSNDGVPVVQTGGSHLCLVGSKGAS